jgi:perosamine synthetase
MKPWIGEAEASAARDAILSGWVAQGPRVGEFERAFVAHIGATEGIAVSSCTAGLHLAMVALGLGPGDEVVVPSLSFIATANAVRYVGATPVFADVDPDSLNLTVDTIAEALTASTRAVVVVHQAGVPADLDPIRTLCESRSVTMVEDAACAIGSTYRGSYIGSGSGLAAFSFHPRKLLTTGEGGMVVCQDSSRASLIRRLREHGMSVSASARHAETTITLEDYLEVGFNYRMTDIQAAVGLVQLRRLPAVIQRRRDLARRYHEGLATIEGLRMADDPAWGTTNYQSFWVELPLDFPYSRNEVLAILARRGVLARRGIMAAHLEPAYHGLNHRRLPVTERVTHRSLILPLYHELSDGDQEQVIEAMTAVAAGVPLAATAKSG